MPSRRLVALPVYNEARHVDRVLDEGRRHSGAEFSSSMTALRMALQIFWLAVATFAWFGTNKIAATAQRLLTAFQYAQDHDFELLVTIDCDGQHEPCRIPKFFDAATGDIDLVSGSRYLAQFDGDTPPPPERRQINEQVTAELNRRLGLNLTDASVASSAIGLRPCGG